MTEREERRGEARRSGLVGSWNVTVRGIRKFEVGLFSGVGSMVHPTDPSRPGHSHATATASLAGGAGPLLGNGRREFETRFCRDCESSAVTPLTR